MVKPIGYQTEQEKQRTFRRVVRQYGPAIHAAQDRIAAAEVAHGDPVLNTEAVRSEALEEAEQLSLFKALPGGAAMLIVGWLFLSGFFCL
jgi:hypothetical protein